MNRKTIAILFGGKSTEYGVSLESSYAVLSHIDEEKFDVYMIGINQQGEWKHFEGDISMIQNDTWEQQAHHHIIICPEPAKQSIIELTDNSIQYVHIDALFPIMHGKNGEDGTLQGIIQMSGIPLIGCDVLSSAICMDKHRAHELVKQGGIQVPQSVYLPTKKSYLQKKNRILNMKLPLFIKPIHSGSSYGISRIEDFSLLDQAIDEAFEFDNEVIVEEEIEGFEVGCAVMGNQELTIGRVDEIELSSGFFNFEEKYTLKTSNIHMPARIDPKMEKKIQETAKNIYQILGCRVFARVDMFLTPDHQIVFNEVNTIPGFTSHSRYPNMMKGIGIEFKELLTRLIEMGIEDEDFRTYEK